MKYRRTKEDANIHSLLRGERERDEKLDDAHKIGYSVSTNVLKGDEERISRAQEPSSDIINNHLAALNPALEIQNGRYNFYLSGSHSRD